MDDDENLKWMAISVVIEPREEGRPAFVEIVASAGLQRLRSGRLSYDVPEMPDPLRMLQDLERWLREHVEFLREHPSEFIDVRIGCSSGDDGQMCFAVWPELMSLLVAVDASLMIDVHA